MPGRSRGLEPRMELRSNCTVEQSIGYLVKGARLEIAEKESTGGITIEPDRRESCVRERVMNILKKAVNAQRESEQLELARRNRSVNRILHGSQDDGKAGLGRKRSDN